MSKINAIRLINLNYNYNTIHIGDKTLHFNGESTLVDIDNGGGKSVITQVLLGLFVQKRYRSLNSRDFADYFTTSKPTFVLVEWVLDKGAGYVLTGMMVRKNQGTEDGNELDMINFVSEYKEPCVHDIHHLPVVEEKNDTMILKSYSACKSIFESYKKDRSVSFNYYDMNNNAQSKQYFTKLMEFGIDHKEWQSIIRKINGDESGLSKFFTDCKNEKDLVEKWFLEAVENKLNKEKNLIQEFQSIVEKYITMYYRNKDAFKRRNAIQKFQEEAERMERQGTFWKTASEECVQSRNLIACYLKRLMDLQEETNKALEDMELYLKQLQEEKNTLKHHKYSAMYHAKQKEIESLEHKIHELEYKIQMISEEENNWVKTLHTYSCAKQQELVNEDQAELTRIEQLLDVCRKDNKNLLPERDYLGYLIRENITSCIKEQERVIASQMALKQETANALQQCKGREKEVQEQLLKLSSQEGSLLSLLKSFNQTETQFNRKWKTAFSRNIFDEYENDFTTTRQESEIEEKEKSIVQKKKQKEMLDRRLPEISDRMEKLQSQKAVNRQELFEAKKEKEKFDKELKERYAIMQYLEIEEEHVYDADRIMLLLNRKIAVLDAVITDMTSEITELSKQIHQMKIGISTEIPKEVAQEFQSLDIHVVHGMEWLKKNGYSEEKNLKLVEQHPFLPYAIILTEQDLEKLKLAETKIHTPFPIPIVTRESLSGHRSVSISNVIEMEDVSFYMLFHKNLLNEQKLQSLINSLQDELQIKKGKLEQRKQEYREYLDRKNTLLRQDITKPKHDALLFKIENLEAESKNIETSLAESKQEKNTVKKQIEEEKQNILSLEKAISQLKDYLEEFHTFSLAYEQYKQRKISLTECQNQKESTAKEAERQAKQKKELEDKIHDLDIQMIENRQKLEQYEQELLKYKHHREVPSPDSVDPSLSQNDISLLKSRYTAISEKISKTEKELEEEQAKAEKRVSRSKKELYRLSTKYGLIEEDWKDIQYSEREEEYAEKKIHETTIQKNEWAEEKKTMEISYAKESNEQEFILKQMEQDCQKSEPVPKEDVILLDFDKEESRLSTELTNAFKQKEILKDKEQMYSQNLAALAEYDSISCTMDKEWEEDFTQFSPSDLKKYTGNLIKKLKQCEAEENRSKSDFIQMLNKIARYHEFQEDFFKKPMDNLLSIVVSESAVTVLKQVDILKQTYADLYEKIMADISIVEEEKDHIVMLIQDYIENVHKQIKLIDRNSSIILHKRRVPMLKIGLPVWEENENIYHIRIMDMLDHITEEGISILSKKETLHEFLGKRLTIKELYDSVIGIHNISIQLYKIEKYSSIPITWREVAKNSGGEGFVSAFVILSSLLYYMHRDENDIFGDNNEGKVLIMDNPFAKTQSAHLLDPLMEIARKNNIQLICLSAINTPAIFDIFDNIYELKLEDSRINGKKYLLEKHTKGTEPKIFSLSRIEVAEEEQLSFLF